MIRNLVLFFGIFSLFGNSSELREIEKEKEGLISRYIERIDEAQRENLPLRVELLNETLNCFYSSRSKKDISNCKIDERKRINSLIRG